VIADEGASSARASRPTAWTGEGRATRPRKRFGPLSEASVGNGHPLLFGFAPTVDYGPWPDGGGYPHGFLEKAYLTLGVTDPTKVLHLCSGSVTVGVTVDIREMVRPRVVADATRLPFADETFDWIMCDPPYNREYAENLYGVGTKYPSPGKMLREAGRVLRPNGKVGMLHFLVSMFEAPLQLVGTWGITTGLGYQIRAWTVYQKQQATLL
jgi:SAM-dependent methyltransferase